MTDEPSAPEKNSPFMVIKDGLLSVTIWKNKNKEGKEFFTSTLNRRYNDGEEWKDAGNLSQTDVLKASNLLMIAYNNILCSKDDFEPS